MATIVVGCMCVQITIVEGTGIKQIQPKSDLLPEAIFTGCQHVTMATVLIEYKVVQSLMLTIVKLLPGVINCCHDNHCGRLYVNPKVYGYR